MKATIILLSYNQEKTIKGSLLSAINQEYSNFTVIICDDGSTDATPTIINEVIRNCSRKDIELIFLPSLKNEGIVYNFNKAVPYVKGDFFITQAGDDISKPNRLLISEKIFSTQIAASAYFSATEDIHINDINTNTNYALKIHKRNKKLGGVNVSNCILDEAGILGASAGYKTKILFNNPLPTVTFSEDKLLTLRASSVGEVLYSPDKLVKYRIGSGVTVKNKQNLKLMSKLMYRRNKFLKSIILDNYIKNNISNLDSYKKKIIKLRLSTVLSHKLLRKKISILNFIIISTKKSLYNKIILRAVYYLTKSKLNDR